MAGMALPESSVIILTALAMFLVEPRPALRLDRYNRGVADAGQLEQLVVAGHDALLES